MSQQQPLFSMPSFFTMLLFLFSVSVTFVYCVAATDQLNATSTHSNHNGPSDTTTSTAAPRSAAEASSPEQGHENSASGAQPTALNSPSTSHNTTQTAQCSSDNLVSQNGNKGHERRPGTPERSSQGSASQSNAQALAAAPQTQKNTPPMQAGESPQQQNTAPHHPPSTPTAQQQQQPPVGTPTTAAATLSLTAGNNYASSYLGAKVVEHHKDAVGVNSLLREGKESYLNIPCKADRKRFTVQLAREIVLSVVSITSLEYFSSFVKNFTLLGARSYPCAAPECRWRVLGHFQAKPTRQAQHFAIPRMPPVRYLRFLWVSHYGREKSCTMTFLQVFGTDVLEHLAAEIANDGIDHSAADEQEGPEHAFVDGGAANGAFEGGSGLGRDIDEWLNMTAEDLMALVGGGTPHQLNGSATGGDQRTTVSSSSPTTATPKKGAPPSNQVTTVTVLRAVPVAAPKQQTRAESQRSIDATRWQTEQLLRAANASDPHVCPSTPREAAMHAHFATGPGARCHVIWASRTINITKTAPQHGAGNGNNNNSGAAHNNAQNAKHWGTKKAHDASLPLGRLFRVVRGLQQHAVNTNTVHAALEQRLVQLREELNATKEVGALTQSRGEARISQLSHDFRVALTELELRLGAAEAEAESKHRTFAVWAILTSLVGGIALILSVAKTFVGAGPSRGSFYRTTSDLNPGMRSGSAPPFSPTADSSPANTNSAGSPKQAAFRGGSTIGTFGETLANLSDTCGLLSPTYVFAGDLAGASQDDMLSAGAFPATSRHDRGSSVTREGSQIGHSLVSSSVVDSAGNTPESDLQTPTALLNQSTATERFCESVDKALGKGHNNSKSLANLRALLDSPAPLTPRKEH